jgi:glycosyltransferase involved in cell wall biosynthesis
MISVLITHYNRPKELQDCIAAFRHLGIKDLVYVVSDDASKSENQEILSSLKVDKVIYNETNRGLASTINRGLDHCNTPYVLYCQEDFLPRVELAERLPELLEVLNSGQADMIRLKANYTFPKLLDLTPHIKLIPKFSWKNFYYNAFQYSDHPFITTKKFFEKFGKYLEETSGPYGENEYAIRIMKSKAKIAIVTDHLFIDNKKARSVIDSIPKQKRGKILKRLKIHKFLRAIRLHLEWIFYRPKKRGLLTIKNRRKK